MTSTMIPFKLLRFSLFLLLPVSILTPHTAAAQESGSGTEKAYASAWIPEIVVDSLENGLKIYYCRVNDIPLTEVSVVVDAGLRNEQEGQEGLAYITAQMLMQGSKDWTREMITNRLDQLSSVVLPHADYDYAQLYAKSLSRNFRGTMELLADAVVAPRFPASQLEIVKRELAPQLTRMTSSPAQNASVLAIRTLCGDQSPLSRPKLPSPADINRWYGEQLREFHARHYTPDRTAIIIAGSIDYTFARTLIVEAFGRWQHTTDAMRAVERRTEPFTRAITVIDDTSGSKQLAFYRIAAQALPRNHRDFPVEVLLNYVLGEGRSSRLMQTLWGSSVISPTFTTSLGLSRDCSYMMISGSASPALADSVFARIEDLLITVARKGITEEELTEAKRTLLQDSPLTYSSNRNLLSLIKEAVVYGLPIDSALRFSERIQSISTEDLRRVAAQVLHQDGMVRIVAGDAEKITSHLGSRNSDVIVVKE